MRLIKRIEEYIVDSEEDAIKLIQNFKDDAEKNGYTLGESGYKYKTKKAKGDIIAQVWICKIAKILGGVWDDYE